MVSTYVAGCYFHSSANDGACNGSLIANPLPNFPLPSVEWYSLRRASVPCILSVSLATLAGTYYRYRQGQRPFYMGTGRKESQEKKASRSNALLRLRTTSRRAFRLAPFWTGDTFRRLSLVDIVPYFLRFGTLGLFIHGDCLRQSYA